MVLILHEVVVLSWTLYIILFVIIPENKTTMIYRWAQNPDSDLLRMMEIWILQPSLDLILPALSNRWLTFQVEREFQLVGSWDRNHSGPSPATTPLLAQNNFHLFRSHFFSPGLPWPAPVSHSDIYTKFPFFENDLVLW